MFRKSIEHLLSLGFRETLPYQQCENELLILSVAEGKTHEELVRCSPSKKKFDKILTNICLCIELL